MSINRSLDNFNDFDPSETNHHGLVETFNSRVGEILVPRSVLYYTVTVTQRWDWEKHYFSSVLHGNCTSRVGRAV